MIIYQIKFPNGKSYIGQTYDLKKRQREHCFISKYHNHKLSSYPIYKAIRKYGWNSIKWNNCK